MNAGTNLDLANGAAILSYSPIKFIGSDDNPVIINSSDSTGQGLAVLNAHEKSFLENVVFENLSAPSQNDWLLTGAVTFYESPSNCFKCQFLGSRSEDSLNIIRSNFMINHSLFQGGDSDALDVDFGEGSILNTSFVDSGNDAVDFSGSVINISELYINGTGDKGISVGENSQVTVKQIEIRNSKVSVASKDFSEIDIKDIHIYNSEIGFAAYQKKPEFGPATMSVLNGTFTDVSIMYLIEERSILTLDGSRIEGTQTDVAEGLYED
jgi:hypothetical protein